MKRRYKFIKFPIIIYSEGKKLGQGGFGEVVECELKSYIKAEPDYEQYFPTKVAVKKLDPTKCHHINVNREIGLAKELNHENIVYVLGDFSLTECYVWPWSSVPET